MRKTIAKKKGVATLPALPGSDIPLGTHVVSASRTASTSALTGYLAQVHRYPLLSEAEELSLLNRVHDDNDRAAAEQLVLGNLRFVIHIARTYQGYGLGIADLIQEGNIGLIKAIKRFNPKHGVRLITFAVHWIRSEIHEFIVKNWKIVKIATTKAQRKLFYRLRSMKKEGQWFTADEIKGIAQELQVKPADVTLMEQRLIQQDVPLESSPENGDDQSPQPKQPIHYLSSPQSSEPEESAAQENEDDTKHELLQVALLGLDDRSKEIIKLRYLTDEKATFDTIAKKMKVSIERVRQIEARALKKMREQVSTALAS